MSYKLSKSNIPTVAVPGFIPYAWNPVTGCANIDCPMHPFSMSRNYSGKCWSYQIAHRWKKDNEFKPTLHKNRLNVEWPKKPACIFVCSQTDIAYLNPFLIENILGIVARASQEYTHIIWQFLTKNPDVYKIYQGKFDSINNAWLGATTMGLSKKVPWINPHVKGLCYLYCEPVMGPIDIGKAQANCKWVVIGGGNHGIKSKQKNVNKIIDGCKKYNIPYFYKGGAGLREPRPEEQSFPEVRK